MLWLNPSTPLIWARGPPSEAPCMMMNFSTVTTRGTDNPNIRPAFMQPHRERLKELYFAD